MARTRPVPRPAKLRNQSQSPFHSTGIMEPADVQVRYSCAEGKNKNKKHSCPSVEARGQSNKHREQNMDDFFAQDAPQQPAPTGGGDFGGDFGGAFPSFHPIQRPPEKRKEKDN